MMFTLLTEIMCILTFKIQKFKTYTHYGIQRNVDVQKRERSQGDQRIPGYSLTTELNTEYLQVFSSQLQLNTEYFEVFSSHLQVNMNT